MRNTQHIRRVYSLYSYIKHIFMSPINYKLVLWKPSWYHKHASNSTFNSSVASFMPFYHFAHWSDCALILASYSYSHTHSRPGRSIHARRVRSRRGQTLPNGADGANGDARCAAMCPFDARCKSLHNFIMHETFILMGIFCLFQFLPSFALSQWMKCGHSRSLRYTHSTHCRRSACSSLV